MATAMLYVVSPGHRVLGMVLVIVSNYGIAAGGCVGRPAARESQDRVRLWKSRTASNDIALAGDVFASCRALVV